MTSLVISSSALLLSIIVCALVYKKLEPRLLRLFVYFLLLSFFTQIGGYLYSYYTRKSNHLIFNFEIMLEFAFYIFIFYRTLEVRKLKLFTLLLAGIFTTFLFYNLFWGESILTFNFHTYFVGSLVVLICCFLFFAEMFTAEYVINFFRIPMFWITTGLFFSYVGNFIYLAMFGYIQRNNLDPSGKIFTLINVVLNVMLNLLFTIGFLCNYKWKKARS